MASIVSKSPDPRDLRRALVLNALLGLLDVVEARPVEMELLVEGDGQVARRGRAVE
jgi:hypothetical protein